MQEPPFPFLRPLRNGHPNPPAGGEGESKVLSISKDEIEGACPELAEGLKILSEPVLPALSETEGSEIEELKTLSELVLSVVEGVEGLS